MSSIINNAIATVHTPKMRQSFARTAWTIATLTVKQRFGPKCDISWEPSRQPKRPKPANFKVAVFAGLASLEDTIPRSDHSSFVYNKRVWSSCRWLKATIRIYSNSQDRGPHDRSASGGRASIGVAASAHDSCAVEWCFEAQFAKVRDISHVYTAWS